MVIIQTDVSQRFRRPENLEINPTYAGRTKAVNNYRNRNTWQKKPKPIPVKRIAVYNAYNKVRKVSAEFKVPCVKKAFGEDIVRVCCRTIQQLDNIAVILKHLMKVDYIIEIGMPLEYSYKMKSLVLFIKPKNKKISNNIVEVFDRCKFRYPHSVIGAEHPHSVIGAEHPKVAAEKFSKEVKMNNSIQEGQKVPQNVTYMCILESAKEEAREMKEFFNPTLLVLLKIGLIFFSLFLIFKFFDDDVIFQK